MGEKGHYYHQSIIMPNCLRLLNFNGYPEAALLDLACGQGVLSRHIPFDVNYVGIDAAKSLINSARQFNPPQHHEFIVADTSKDLPIKKSNFTHSTVILALQNIEHPLNVFKNVHKHLISEGQFLLVLNHPCFRIPRQSSWQMIPIAKFNTGVLIAI